MTAVGITGGLKKLGSVPRGRLTAGAVAVALLLTWPFGGLRESRAALVHAVPLSLGHPVDTGPLRVTLTGAATYTKLTKTEGDGSVDDVLAPSDPSHHVMVVRATVVNTWTSSVGSVLVTPVAFDGTHDRVVFPLGGAAPTSADNALVLSADDATEVGVLSPGVTYHLALVYEYAGEVPTTIKVGLARLSNDPSYIDRSEVFWQHPRPAYTATLAVTDKTAATP